MSVSKRWILALAVVFAGLAASYLYISTGGLIARQTPSSIETNAATWVLNLSVPSKAKQQKNHLGETDASVTAGHVLYQQKCEVCHGSDGTGKTEAGSGQYPTPFDLRGSAIKARTDGELFYFIQNGIRNTAMPGWQIPDQNIWQLVTYIRALPKVASMSAQARPGNGPVSAQFTGSSACKSCHSDIYARWSKTLMANVVRDPREHPDAIIPDLSKPDPLVTFAKDDIAFVYGSKWKQRYFKKVGNDYFPLPAQWDVTHKAWKPYHPAKGTDWWTHFYPDGNMQRPTGPLCDGCHSVNFNIANNTVTEWNVGCEKCHGPGSEHVKNAVASNISNPARFNYVEATDICAQCHSQGQPLKKPIEGKYYDWPVGYQVGQKLSDFWKFEEHKLGEQTFTHFADGTAHKNRMQGNDFAGSLMYTHGVSCFTCHDAHGTKNDALLRKPGNSLCLDCHGPNSPNGPRAATMEQHTHHKTGSPGSECVACHMPKIETTLGDVNVRSHTFKFIPPSSTETLKVPNSCNSCHTDKSVQWTKDALKSWSEFSPWRVAE
ncbi:MAG: cytochrome c3 family protein [Bryobacteraceae bacterium]